MRRAEPDENFIFSVPTGTVTGTYITNYLWVQSKKTYCIHPGRIQTPSSEGVGAELEKKFREGGNTPTMIETVAHRRAKRAAKIWGIWPENCPKINTSSVSWLFSGSPLFLQ